jgi:hypothetical protein
MERKRQEEALNVSAGNGSRDLVHTYLTDWRVSRGLGVKLAGLPAAQRVYVV